MDIIRLEDLPHVADRTGWPWSKGSPPLPQTAPNGLPWPRVSIVTPSFNQGQFLEETIRSVLLQGYPNLEYLIVDGGSKDNSAEIIRKYEPWLTYWVSEPDRGQPHAINKGWARATGSIWAWQNSDDIYMPGAIGRAVSVLLTNPSNKLVYSSSVFTDATGSVTQPFQARPLQKDRGRMRYWDGWPVPQPTMFFDKILVDKYGFLDEDFHNCMDYEWLIRVSKYEEFICLQDEVLATYRIHAESKTGDGATMREVMWKMSQRANRKHAPLWWPRTWRLHAAEAWFYAKRRMHQLGFKI